MPAIAHGADVNRRAVNDWLSFAQRMARNPRAVGAVSPSGPALAQAMAAEVDPDSPGRILELGPGTGAITRALLDRGVPADKILAVEADGKFARLLRERIPGIEVLEGDAMDAEEIGARGPFAAVISSLPLLNFPDAEVSAFVEAMLEMLPPGAPFVQYSYGVKPPVPKGARVTMRLAAKVWRNLPPARIWVFTAAPANGAATV